MYAGIFKTPFGWIAVASTDAGVSRVIMPCKGRGIAKCMLEGAVGRDYCGYKELPKAVSGLMDYFDGENVDLSTHLLDMKGATEFRRRVWSTVRRIPYGCTLTYGQVACMIDRPNAARAVGSALNFNPVPVLVPCHRVLAAEGLGGFSSGREQKRRMLEMEGIL